MPVLNVLLGWKDGLLPEQLQVVSMPWRSAVETVQLQELLGFSTDHEASLWCHELQRRFASFIVTPGGSLLGRKAEAAEDTAGFVHKLYNTAGNLVTRLPTAISGVSALLLHYCVGAARSERRFDLMLTGLALVWTFCFGMSLLPDQMGRDEGLGRMLASIFDRPAFIDMHDTLLGVLFLFGFLSYLVDAPSVFKLWRREGPGNASSDTMEGAEESRGRSAWILTTCLLSWASHVASSPVVPAIVLVSAFMTGLAFFCRAFWKATASRRLHGPRVSAAALFLHVGILTSESLYFAWLVLNYGLRDAEEAYRWWG